MRSERRAELFESVERATELPMLVLAVAILPLLLLPLVLELPPAAETTVFALDWVIWAAFGLELGVKTYLAPARVRYLRAHWVDVLIVIVPFLRPLRVARSARALRALRLIRIGVFALRLRASSGIILDSPPLRGRACVGVTACAGFVRADDAARARRRWGYR